MSRPLKNLTGAIALLTGIRMPSAWMSELEPGVAAWFPAVGLLYGAAGYAIVKLADLAHLQHRAPYLVATLVVILWGAMSRLLHWDALADVGDAYWGSEDPARRLEILSDSRTGAFGVTTVMFVALLEVTALGLIVDHPHEFVVAMVPVLARFSATAAAWSGGPARPAGLGRSVTGRPTLGGALVGIGTALLAVIALSSAYRQVGVATSVVGVATALAVPWVLSRRFGGVTGDVMGAGVQLTEAITLAAFALIVHAVG